MDKDKGSDKDKGYSVQGDGKDKKNDGDMGKKDSGKGDDNQGEVDEIIVEHWTIPMTTTITTATTTTWCDLMWWQGQQHDMLMILWLT